MNDIPKQIDRYPIIRSLGKGGMGEVYLAFDPICERKIAIKCIRSDLLKYKNVTERFLNEAKIASQLSHPSIIPIYSIHVGDEKMYYIMPYVEGETLKQIVRETHFRQKEGREPHPIGHSIQALLRVFLHVCHAIAYAHSKGFLHRDLKPENIIVGKFGEVLVLDWGLAEKIIHPIEEAEMEMGLERHPSLTRIGKIVGTLSYMPPERIKGKKADLQTDIYALGVILYQILSLRLPFKRKTIKESEQKIDFEVYVDPVQLAPTRDIPKALSLITEKVLHPNPEERYQSVSALIHDIEKYLEGRPDWTIEASLDINKVEDFTFQETVLLNPHTAITQLGPLSEWVILMLAKGSFPGNIKIEATLTLLPKSHGVGLLFGLPSSNAKEALQRGFCLWLGSKTNPGAQLFLDNVQVLDCPSEFVEQEGKICIEKIDSNVFVSINEKLILKYVGHIPIMGSQVGLICKDMQFTIKDWKVFSGSQNAMVNCLSIPDAFFASKHFDKALYEYRKIADSFKGRSESREALFRSGITLLEMAKTCTTHKEKEKLTDKAYEEFERLGKTSGAPLEYLGKSLIYREEKDREEEAKCLELALRKYPSHPMLFRIHDHVIFRFHELSAKDRQGTYLFALIVIRYLHDLSSHNTKQLIQLLRQYLQPLFFFSPFTPSQGHDTEMKDLAIQLAFWLNKPLILLEMSEGISHHELIESIFFALMALQDFPSVQKLLEKHPHPVLEKICFFNSEEAELWISELSEESSTLDLKITLSLLDRFSLSHYRSFLPLFNKIRSRFADHDLEIYLDYYEVLALLKAGSLDQARSLLSKHSSTNLAKTASPLYLAAVLFNRLSTTAFPLPRLIKEKHPALYSLIPHYLGKSLPGDWHHHAFDYEKDFLEKGLLLLEDLGIQKDKKAPVSSLKEFKSQSES